MRTDKTSSYLEAAVRHGNLLRKMVSAVRSDKHHKALMDPATGGSFKFM